MWNKLNKFEKVNLKIYKRVIIFLNMDRGKILISAFTGLFIVLAIIFSVGYFNNQENKMNEENNEGTTTVQKALAFSFKDKVDSEEYVIIDIRTPQEFNSEHIQGAINIDYYSPTFEEEISSLDKDKKYLFYCRSGSRSSNALPLFRELGFREVYELQGGIQSWVSSGYELELN